VTKAAVFGTGSWGTAFAMVLADAGCEVTLWGRRAELAEAVNDRRVNPDYLPGVELPAAVRATTDPAEAADGAEFTVLAVPSQTLRGNLAGWAPLLHPGTVLVSLMKGVELGTAKRMSEVVEEVAGVGRSRVPPPPSWPARTPPWRSVSRRPATPRTSARTRTRTSSAANSAERSRT
jgi:glycerol-3-phosphate dehydrogenase (NAD(P)+)